MDWKKYDIDFDPIRKLRRCTKCVLPETMPFIEFDEQGVCNYCRTYKRQTYAGREALVSLTEKLKQGKGEYDSLASFSGGRDSCYGLHYFVKELGMKPLAYSYDWGMVTDIAFRNQKRMCDALGVKLITVQADIAKKRNNIRKNITAWLKHPDLGLIPLFMAGDKQFFYYANKVGHAHGLDTVLMTSNPFEETHFKSGFCGVKPRALRNCEKSTAIERLPLGAVVKMASFYAKQFLVNPGYINGSVLDTASGVLSCFLIPHNYLRLYDYIPWDEEVVNNTLINTYDWEISPDTQSTWRIGDGTAPFYNYLYCKLAGFTENDTLRSNQIREGMLTRKKALELVYRDNQVRWESMKWYFDVIGMDMENVLEQVCRIPKIYEL